MGNINTNISKIKYNITNSYTFVGFRLCEWIILTKKTKITLKGLETTYGTFAKKVHIFIGEFDTSGKVQNKGTHISMSYLIPQPPNGKNP